MDNRQKKIQLFNQVLNPKEIPDKVPLYLNLQGWIVYHTAGYGYNEAVYSSDKLLDAYEHAINEFEADIYYDMGGYASMFPSKCLGSDDYFLNDEKYSLNFKDVSYLSSAEDYKALAKNPQEFLWNHFYQKKFKNLEATKAKETLRDYLHITQQHFEKSEEVKLRIRNKTGALFLSDVPMYQTSFDYLFQYIVGMKGISMDMRRNKDNLLQGLESLESLFDRFMEEIAPPLSKDESPFQVQLCMLGQTIANKRQFEQFIWPFFSKKIKEYTEKGLQYYFMVQGSSGPLLEYLDFIPDNSCALHVEMDSIDALKERFGNKFTYVGGMPVSVLGSSTLDECRKYTHKILEKYGHEGNFIFSTDKGIGYEADATVDNLKLVCEMVNTFTP